MDPLSSCFWGWYFRFQGDVRMMALIKTLKQMLAELKVSRKANLEIFWEMCQV